MRWARELTGMRPYIPEVIMISLAGRQTGIPSRSRFLRLTNICASAFARRPDWIRLSPGKYGHP
eukprot:8532279-Pyramimonas_sp.AAC.1